MDFKNKRIILASKHQKEKVIAPIFKENFDCDIFVPENFDTDLFGTFTLEKKRLFNQKETAKLKAIKACEYFKYDFAISSEGSFGPHHQIYGIYSNLEIVCFYNAILNKFSYGYSFTSDTNFQNKICFSLDEILNFASSINFPSHNIILKTSSFFGLKKKFFKDFKNKDDLVKTSKDILSKFRKVEVLTDMRAMYNPTRMNNIKKATENLVFNLKQDYDII